MIARAIFLVFSLATLNAVAGEALVLRSDSLGPLDLSGSDPTVSEAKLKKLFPQYVVKYDIAYGDSPDFHYFEVLTLAGEVLFTIKSFIPDAVKSEKTIGEVPISLLRIHSKEIQDSYGLRVGDRVSDIVAKRGKSLKYGAGHFDALMGGDKIYYSLITRREESPEGLGMNDATKHNWEIRFISWPEAAWE